MEILPWAFGLLGILLLVGGGWWYWHTGREQSQPAKRSRGQRQKPLKELVASSEQEATYCHQCGKRAGATDRFCRSCGSKLRVN